VQPEHQDLVAGVIKAAMALYAWRLEHGPDKTSVTTTSTDPSYTHMQDSYHIHIHTNMCRTLRF
jgi:hypothetical protein